MSVGELSSVRGVTSAQAPYAHVPWKPFLDSLELRQGEHITIIKPTGGGKSSLASLLLDKHPAGEQISFITKSVDKTITEQFPRKKGWVVAEDFDDIPRYADRILLWPKFRENNILSYMARQKAIFHEAISRVGKQGGWTLFQDETHVLCKTLGLAAQVEWIQNQGRSSGLTGVTGMQRPSWIPVACYSNATHAFIGRTTTLDDTKRLAEFAGDVESRKRLVSNAARLGKFDFIYVNTREPDQEPVIINTRK